MEHAYDGLDAEVYTQLRKLAGRIHRGQGRADAGIQPTDLVHEAWMKVAQSRSEVVNRSHFIAIAAKAMRQILVDRARARASQKRGGDPIRTTLSKLSDSPMDGDTLLAVDLALDKLREIDPAGADVVVMRAFGGATVPETAEALGLSASSVDRAWRFARAFIADQLT